MEILSPCTLPDLGYLGGVNSTTQSTTTNQMPFGMDYDLIIVILIIILVYLGLKK